VTVLVLQVIWFSWHSVVVVLYLAVDLCSLTVPLGLVDDMCFCHSTSRIGVDMVVSSIAEVLYVIRVIVVAKDQYHHLTMIDMWFYVTL